MTEPQCVLDAVKDYKQEMDLLAGFLEQCIEVDYDSDYSIMASDLFALYSTWAKRNNEYEMTSKKFFREISKKLPEKGRSSKGIYYSNISLTEYAKGLQGRSYSFADFN